MCRAARSRAIVRGYKGRGRTAQNIDAGAIAFRPQRAWLTSPSQGFLHARPSTRAKLGHARHPNPTASRIHRPGGDGLRPRRWRCTWPYSLPPHEPILSRQLWLIQDRDLIPSIIPVVLPMLPVRRPDLRLGKAITRQQSHTRRQDHSGLKR
jgi:hypothetical protein